MVVLCNCSCHAEAYRRRCGSEYGERPATDCSNVDNRVEQFKVRQTTLRWCHDRTHIAQWRVKRPGPLTLFTRLEIRSTAPTQSCDSIFLQYYKDLYCLIHTQYLSIHPSIHPHALISDKNPYLYRVAQNLDHWPLWVEKAPNISHCNVAIYLTDPKWRLYYTIAGIRREREILKIAQNLAKLRTRV